MKDPFLHKSFQIHNQCVEINKSTKAILNFHSSFSFLANKNTCEEELSSFREDYFTSKKKILLFVILWSSVLMLLFQLVTSMKRYHPITAGTSIKPFIFNNNGKKIWLSELSNPKSLLVNKANFSVKKQICLFFQDNISFLKSVSLSFFSRFFPYFLYFGILPRYFSAKGSLKTNKTFNTAQDSLEARPYYWDQSNVPEDTFTIERPLDVKIISNKNIIQSNTKSSDEIYQITMDHGGKFKFWEGQSVGIINPSDTIPTENYMDKNNTISDIKYNIASSRYGDEKRGRTLSIICPRRSNSNDFLYDSKPGEYIKITGPHFKTNIFPETDPKMDYILIATGELCNIGESSFNDFVAFV